MAGGSQRIYKQRIKSTQSLKKMFRAQELIAASRIGKARARTAAAAPYERAITRAVSAVATHTSTKHPLTSERHDTDRVSPLLGPAQLGDEVDRRIRGAGVVPEQRRPDDGTVLVQADHAVLLTADRDGRHVVQSTCLGHSGLEGGPPRLGVHLGAVRMPAATTTYEGTGLGVPDHDLAGLGGRVHTGDERHAVPPGGDEYTASLTSRAAPTTPPSSPSSLSTMGRLPVASGSDRR